jgi:WS/DGAT/MGAT family acyltransferase
MKQLGIVDSAFVNLEHPTVPQHVGGLGIYDPSTAPDGFVRFKQVLSNFEMRLHRVPVFRTRLVDVPLGLDRPYWVIDENFDVEFHIRHIALPKPGDWRQLCIQVARLHARPLDMSRPLWECYIIEGLDNIDGVAPGGFAVYTKMHHSLVDGAGGQAFMMALHDLEPDPAPSEPAAEDVIEDTQPSDATLLGKTVLNRMKEIPGDVRGFFSLSGDVLRMVNRIRTGDLPHAATDAPKTRFDEPVGPHRVFDAISLDLAEVKAIKDGCNATINDVVVTVIAGAVRKYLMAHDELPEEPLAASMPVNMRTRKGETEDANQIGTIMGLVHTDIADPKKRLKAIQKSMEDAKAFIDTPFADTLKLAGYFSPMIARRLAGIFVDNALTRRLPMGYCGIITNIPGAQVQLYCAGARLTDYHCLGVLTPGTGVCNAVFSMNKKVSMSFLADRNCIPDPDLYRQSLEESYAELKQAVLGKSKTPRKKSVRKKAKRKKTARKKTTRRKPAGKKAAGK